MKTSWPSSKKCSIANAAVALTLWTLALPAWAAKIPTESLLREELLRARSGSFEPLLKQWGAAYGTGAVAPLLRIARDRDAADPHRYIALMGAAKLGGPASASLLKPFLKDPSWMLRSGALRALSAVKPASPSPSFPADAVLPLLKDPALVVRVEAVEATARLQPPGAAQALLEILERPENYHGGRAQWVPQRALDALRLLRAREAAPRLRPLLDRSQDPELLKKTIETLESLTGRSVPKHLSLQSQAREWKSVITR